MSEGRIPRLMLITDRRRSSIPLPELATAAVEGGVDAVQVREKDLSSEALHDVVSSVVDAVAGRACVLVNGNIEVARTLGIGAHLPEHGPSASEARQALPPGSLVGRSIHDPKAAALERSADYVIAGHVYSTTSKSGMPGLGLDGLANVVASASLPVIAVGGIDASVVGDALDRGAHGVAVISAINSAADPRSAARRLRAEIDRFEERTMERYDASSSIELTINGKDVVLPHEMTISDFLSTKGLTERMVVVELNGEVLARSSYASTLLRDGDRVEMVHAVGGG